MFASIEAIAGGLTAAAAVAHELRRALERRDRRRGKVKTRVEDAEAVRSNGRHPNIRS